MRPVFSPSTPPHAPSILCPWSVLLLFAVLLGTGDSGAAQESDHPTTQPPNKLPSYHLDVEIDPAHSVARVRQRVTWSNRHARPTGELVFNAFAAYKLPPWQLPVQAKLLELERLAPSEALDVQGHALQHLRCSVVQCPGPGMRPGQPLTWSTEELTRLVVSLPAPLACGASVTVDLEYTLRLPPRQGRWGLWKGVVSLANFYPVLAYHDDRGWQPAPYVPWHPAIFHEAATYSARVTLPAGHAVACGCSVERSTDLDDGRVCLDFAPRLLRDFALVASPHYREFSAWVGTVRMRCLADPAHEHYARVMLQAACTSVAAYTRWFGPLLHPEITIVEAFPGCGGSATCSGLLLADARFFTLPKVAAGLAELMVFQQISRQWWGGAVGTNGYAETWMDEGLANYFGHRLMDREHGKNNGLLRWPKGLSWLPQIERDSYRQANLYETLGSGGAAPVVQELPKFEHAGKLMALVGDKGSKVVGMIADRLGEDRFTALLQGLYARHCYGMLFVADFRRELELFTGRPWREFVANWLYGAGMTDWGIEKVSVVRCPAAFATDNGQRTTDGDGCEVTVLLRQKGEYEEPTVLGIRMGKGDTYPVRIPIVPQDELTVCDDPPARVERISDHRFRVVVLLPDRPTQVVVDPDQVLPDRNPANNYWKAPLKVRLKPLATPLDENELTTLPDRKTITIGPWATDAAYNDPFYPYSGVIGVRAGVYQAQGFAGGLYAGFRPYFNDLAVGFDGIWEHTPFPRTQIGYNVEKGVASLDRTGVHGDRALVYGRYVFEETDSFFGLPMHYLQVFASHTHRMLPPPRFDEPGAERVPIQDTVGVQYHLDLLTPYWDPEVGFRLDVTYAAGLEVMQETASFQELTGQLSFVTPLPDFLGPLSETRLAGRVYGATASPRQSQLFTLGGNQLFRGYDMAERQGSQVWLGSLEWRVPVIRGADCSVCDHAATVQSLSLVPFWDMGAAYIRGRPVGGDIAHALGMGLRVGTDVFSFLERTTLRLDVARTVEGHTPVQYWFGFEHPF